jgi:outer membrane protein assembly factor BamB/tetratricopeptide (TPR) repeat protein
MSDSGNILNSAEVDFLLDGTGSDEPQPKPAASTPAEQAVTMRGDLDQINLADIFQTLAMTKMEGVLRVHNPLEQRQVHCRDGYVRILVPSRVATRRLGQRLVQAGLLHPDQVRAVLVQQRKEKKPVGQLLIEGGLVSAEQVDEIVNMQVAEDLFALFTWRHGTFEFWKGELTDAGLREQFDRCPEFEVNSLLLEVARRSDEWTSILAVIGSLDEVPERKGELPETPDPGDAGRALVYGVDGRSTYRELAEQTTTGLFEVARVARDLVRAGVLGNVADDGLVVAAAAAADAGHHKAALMLLQTLRDRPGDRSPSTVRSMVDVLEKAGERRVAGTLLLEIAQLQTDPEQALALARQARDLAPDDAGTLSFLRTTLLAFSPPESEELERITVALLDALIENDRLDTAMEIVADARTTGTARPQVLLRESRLLQKRRNLPEAASVLFELSEYYRAQNDRARTIETYQAILRLDRSRKDVQKLLRQIRQTRAGRIVRAAAALVCALLLGAMGLVFWQQSRFETALQGAGKEIDACLQAGDRAGARQALTRWSEVLGEAEQLDDLRGQIDFADAAEQTRLQKLERKRINELLTKAAETFGAGDLRAALTIYAGMANDPKLRTEVGEVVAGRFEAALVEMEQVAKAMDNRLPPPPAQVPDRKSLTANLTDLQALCRPALTRFVSDLRKLHAAGALPDYLPATTLERTRAVLAATGALFQQADELAAAYADALHRSNTERRLDPLFKRAVQLEEEHDFAGALEIYRQLEREPAGSADLRAHFRDQVARNATICRLMGALERATAAGDFPVAQQQFRALRLAFPELPFERLVRLPLRIESLPPGATVVCNGAEVGRTPCALAYRPADANALSVALPGFRTEHATITGDQVGLLRSNLLLEPAAIRKHDNLVDAPVLADGDGNLVVVDRGGVVTLLDPRGEPRWTYRSGDLSGLLTRPILHGNHVLVGSIDGELRALDRRTGNVAWSLPNLPTEVGPVLVGDQLVVATTTRQLAVVDLDRRTITTQQQQPDDLRGNLLAAGSTIVVTGATGRVAAFTMPGLTAAWQAALTDFGDITVALAQDRVIAAGDHGDLCALDLATGAQRWHRSGDFEPLGGPIVDDQSVWLTTPQRVLRFALADGKDRPGLSQGEAPWSEAAVCAGPRLLVPSRDGTIHVFDLASANPLYRIEGGKRGAKALPHGKRTVVALPDRRLLFFDDLR